MWYDALESLKITLRLNDLLVLTRLRNCDADSCSLLKWKDPD